MAAFWVSLSPQAIRASLRTFSARMDIWGSRCPLCASRTPHPAGSPGWTTETSSAYSQYALFLGLLLPSSELHTLEPLLWVLVLVQEGGISAWTLVLNLSPSELWLDCFPERQHASCLLKEPLFVFISVTPRKTERDSASCSLRTGIPSSPTAGVDQQIWVSIWPLAWSWPPPPSALRSTCFHHLALWVDAVWFLSTLYTSKHKCQGSLLGFWQHLFGAPQTRVPEAENITHLWDGDSNCN